MEKVLGSQGGRWRGWRRRKCRIDAVRIVYRLPAFPADPVPSCVSTSCPSVLGFSTGFTRFAAILHLAPHSARFHGYEPKYIYFIFQELCVCKMLRSFSSSINYRKLYRFCMEMNGSVNLHPLQRGMQIYANGRCRNDPPCKHSK